MNHYLFLLCWKNLWRNGRRTFLTVGAIGFGMMVMVWLYNYYEAFHNQLVENAIRFHSGHLLIVGKNYDPDRPPTQTIADSPALRRWLSAQKQIKAYSPQVVLQALVSSPRGSANILVKGVDPVLERKTSRFALQTKEGNFLAGKKRSIVIGKKLQTTLKVNLGDKVVVLTQGVDGSIGNELFTISGIFETRSEWDKALAFVTLPSARGLLSLAAGTLHQVPLVLNDEADTLPMQVKLKKDLPQLYSLTWAEVQRSLVALIELDRAANRVYMAILLFLVAIGIVNSILMSVLERKREFGVMLAVGTTKSEVMHLVATETFLMAVVGVALGNTMALLFTLYFQHYGFDLHWLTDRNIVVNGAVLQTVSYPSMQWAHCFLVSGVILAASVLISLLPARQIARLHPVSALRG